MTRGPVSSVSQHACLPVATSGKRLELVEWLTVDLLQNMSAVTPNSVAYRVRHTLANVTYGALRCFDLGRRGVVSGCSRPNPKSHHPVSNG